MKNTSRSFRFLTSLMATVAVSLISPLAGAQDKFPTKPITMVVTYAAGGNADIVARISAERLSKELGVPVKVLNVPGGRHIPGVMNVLNKPADGYTLLRWSAAPMVIGPLVRKVPYDPLKDIVPISASTTAATALYVRGDSPIKTFEQFVDEAKKKKFTIGVNNIGAPPNLSAVQLAQQFGLEFNTLTLKTVPATMTGLLGGQVDVAVGQLTGVKIFGDKLRALAILDNAREAYFAKDLPGVRTVGEIFPGKEAGSWINGGLAIKAGTPDHIVKRLVEAADKAMNNQAFADQISNTITYRWIGGVDAVTAKIKEGIALYKPLLDSLGLLKK
ncbi:MAG: tripartite tricarboxylate transporter substrate binding protein [Burkholderiaceae bacterium]